MRLARTLYRWTFTLGLKLNAALTRSPLRAIEGRVLTPFYVWLTQIVRGRRAVAPEVEAIGREWERLLASRRAATITHVQAATPDTPATAFGRISVHCPLRGTGDVGACHRLMAYDRALVEGVGGQLVVLASQATPGRTQCEIAIRRRADASDDLRAAHLDPAPRS